MEDGIEEVIGEVEREVVEGFVTAKDEESGDPGEEFGSGEFVFVPEFPVERRGRMEGFEWVVQMRK